MRFRSGVLDAVRAHARARQPQECCGLLLGRDVVERAVPAANVSLDPERHYVLDPETHLRYEREGRRGGMQVLGFYHSHPQGDPCASVRDREAAEPGYVYLVAGPTGEKLYATSPWRDEHLEEVT